MRVLVDAHMIGHRETGNETYTVNLISNLAKLPGIECAAAIEPETYTGVLDGKMELLSLPSSNNWSRLLYAVPALCHRWKADLLHVTYTGPLFLHEPMVVSVHDVSFKRYGHFFSPRDRLLFSTLLPWTMKRARAIITLSEHAKREILGFFPYLKDKVHVIHLAANANLGKRTETARENLILAVGNLQPRKNLTRLIQAFDLIQKQIHDVRLVIVGKAQWQSSTVYDMVRQLHLEDKLEFTGYVSDLDLGILYQRARVFVYPTIYEGFGLPVLEAMACGTPVVASNTSAIPEITGNAAVLIDPFNVDEMAKAIIDILKDKEFAKHLSEQGRIQESKFTWEKTAIETVKVYRKVLLGKV